MKPLIAAAMVQALLLTAGVLEAQAPRAPMVSDTSFRNFLARWDAGIVRMLNGDTTEFFANASHGDDVTLYMPNGGVVMGWSEVSKRYRIAAGRMMPNGGATATFDYLSAGSQGDLGYIVVLEHPVAMFKTDTVMQHSITRVTEIFRRENGQWKMMHRHMDHLADPSTNHEAMGKHC